MKQEILKVVGLSIVAFASIVALTNLNKAQSFGTEGATITQSPPAEETVDRVQKNIKVFNGMPVSQLYPAMRFMAASLGTGCGFCHIIENGFINAPADDKPEKQTAREMIKMVVELNKKIGKGNPEVSCYTCHRGDTSPPAVLTLPLPLPVPTQISGMSSSPVAASERPASRTTDSPSADDIFDKYVTAIGGKPAVDAIKSLMTKGTSAVSNGQPMRFESVETAPDKRRESLVTAAGTRELIINGRRGWLKNGDGVQELLGQHLADETRLFPLFMIFKLREQYSRVSVSGQDKIGERNMFVVSATRTDDTSERLYFDSESGFLRRRVRYLRTMIGVIPEEIDFEDYRQVNGLSLPFSIRMFFVDGRSPIVIRKFAEIKLNVPVSESMFDKPAPATRSTP